MASRHGITHDQAIASKPPQKEKSAAHQSSNHFVPNKGMPLNLDWIDEIQVNTSAVERRAQSLVTRRTVKKEWQAAWLLRAITCMDLTTLAGDDSHQRVLRLCAKAKQPVQQSIMKQLGLDDFQLKIAAVCVYHSFVETAVR